MVAVGKKSELCYTEYMISNLALTHEKVANNLFRVVLANVLLIICGTIYVFALSQVVIPLPNTPVLLSLGTFAVLSNGAILGSRRGAASVALFAMLGFAGVPVFQGFKSGFGLVTCGYVFGYIVGSYIVGIITEHMSKTTRISAKSTTLNSVIHSFAAWTLGLVPIYVFGVFFLMIALQTSDIAVGLEKGFYPFLIGEFVKFALALGFIPSMSALVNKLKDKLAK